MWLKSSFPRTYGCISSSFGVPPSIVKVGLVLCVAFVLGVTCVCIFTPLIGRVVWVGIFWSLWGNPVSDESFCVFVLLVAWVRHPELGAISSCVILDPVYRCRPSWNFSLINTPWDYSLALWGPGFSSVQSLSCVRIFVIPCIAARQASLSIMNSQSLLKLMSIKSVMPSSHRILCHPLLLLPQSLPASGSFPMSQRFAWGGQSIRVSASASVLPKNTQDWSLGWTGWISLQSKGLSRVFSNTTVQKHQFFGTRLSLWSNTHIHTWLLEKLYHSCLDRPLSVK